MTDDIKNYRVYMTTGCPYCNTMMTDGVKFNEKEDKISVMDIAELIANT